MTGWYVIQSFSTKKNEFLQEYVLRSLLFSIWISTLVLYLLNLLILVQFIHPIQEPSSFLIITHPTLIDEFIYYFQFFFVIFLIIISFYIIYRLSVSIKSQDSPINDENQFSFSFTLFEMKFSIKYNLEKVLLIVSMVVVFQIIILFFLDYIIPLRGLSRQIIGVIFQLTQVFNIGIISNFVVHLSNVALDDTNNVIVENLVLEIIILDIVIGFSIICLIVSVVSVIGFIKSRTDLKNAFLEDLWNESVDAIQYSLTEKNENKTIQLVKESSKSYESSYTWQFYIQKSYQDIKLLTQNSSENVLNVKTKDNIHSLSDQDSNFTIKCSIDPRTYGEGSVSLILDVYPSFNYFDLFWSTFLRVKSIPITFFNQHFKIFPYQPEFQLEIVDRFHELQEKPN